MLLIIIKLTRQLSINLLVSTNNCFSDIFLGFEEAFALFEILESIIIGVGSMLNITPADLANSSELRKFRTECDRIGKYRRV